MNYATALVQLPLVREQRKEVVRSPEDVARVCSDIRQVAQEVFQVLMLNTKNRLIDRHMVSLGIANASLVHPREVFRPAIVDNASAVVLVHNHPSGDPTPSAEDLRITKQLIEAGKILSIKVQDHVVLGDPAESGRGYVSIREQGMCNFSD